MYINRIYYSNAATSLEESISIIVGMTMINQQNKTERKPYTTESREWKYKTVIM